MDDGPGEAKSVEDQMKAVRASLAAYQPFAGTDWGQQAIAAASAQLDMLRQRLLNLKPPMSRVQS
eukprot:1723738-Lingulodinium_polyedra.AAC.1